MIKLAFDISSTNIGIAVINEDENWFKTYTIKLNYNENDLHSVAKNLREKLIYILCSSGEDEIMVGLEVSNFKNAKLTQRFSLLAGMIIAIVESVWFPPYIEFKMFNSNQWQHLIGCKTTDDRQIRKQKSKEFFKEKTGLDNESDDETDAYCIAYHLEQLESTVEQQKRVRDTKVLKNKNKAKIAQLNKQIITRQNKLLTLKPTQIKMKERLENEIKEIKATISKLNDSRTL